MGKSNDSFVGFEVKQEPKNLKVHEVSTLPIETTRNLSEFEPQNLYDFEGSKYAKLKPKIGPVARTDGDGRDLREKGIAFHMSSLIRDAAGIEDEEARAISQEVVRRVEEIQDEARDNAKREGLERGRSEGIEAGRAEWIEESKDYISRLDMMLSAFENAREEIFASNEKFLVDLTFRIARMILLKELDTDHDYVKRLAKLLIERTGLKENVTLTVGAKDEAMLEEIRDNLTTEISDLKNFQIQVSPDMDSGGCKVETDWNTVNADIDTQLEGLAKSLGQGLSQGEE